MAADGSESSVTAALQQAFLFHRAGQIAEAIPFYQRALTREPQRVDALVNLANAHVLLRQFADAVALYQRAIALRPDSEEIHNNLGNALQAMGMKDDAALSYRRALRLAPNYADAHYNLGNILLGQRRLAPAIESYKRALDLKPDFANALRNLATAYCRSERTADAFALYRQHASLVYGSSAAAQDEPSHIAAHKLRHDLEQRDYLKEHANHGGEQVSHPSFQLADGGRLAGPAVNSANTAAVTEEWSNSNPQLVVIDNLLTEEALAKLQRFCWGSTIWRRVYDDGYLGAMAEHGLACPLLAQIADELRGTFPSIMGRHPLHYLWGFKYDSRLSGINIHADKAAVNVNFWITPDEANLDSNGGGLIVWDAAAPLDWEPAKYNGDISASRDFLSRANARPVKIPYRCNRAVIFDSDLFHETDKIDFKDGYLNRRINITMLFGQRGPDDSVI
jgi:tetratricopeptide (TPR) repeat protein